MFAFSKGRVSSDAFGVQADAPVTVTLRAKRGRLTLATLEYVALLDGKRENSFCEQHNSSRNHSLHIFTSMPMK